jgi:hypothetical protein
MLAKLIVEGKEFDIEILDPKLQELVAPKKKTGYERVEKNKCYWVENAEGGIDFVSECKDVCDDNLYNSANYYESEFVAAQNARADKLMRQLRRFAVEHREQNIEYTNTGVKYTIRFNYYSNELYISHECLGRDFGMIAFDSENVVSLAIETFHNELIWYFTEYKDSL